MVWLDVLKNEVFHMPAHLMQEAYSADGVVSCCFMDDDQCGDKLSLVAVVATPGQVGTNLCICGEPGALLHGTFPVL